MSRCMKVPILCVIAVILLCLVLTIRGPASILYKIDLDGDQLGHGGREFRSVTGDASPNWTGNYTDRLKAAYRADDRGHVNPHDFRLILDEPMACMEQDMQRSKQVLLLVLVATVHSNFERRQAIRETWGSTKELGGLAVVTLFLLATNRDPTLEARVLAESADHRDLLMENFSDSYRNLTLKTLMAMKWASSHCPHASFVMKTDDDMFVSYQNLLHYIAVSGAPRTNLAFGLVIAGEPPIRNPGSKWFMPEELYPDPVYPPWLSGGGFVLSGDVPGKIYAASLDIRYLHLEDVYVGVCLKKLNISPIMNRWFSNLHIPYSYCRYRYVITTHSVEPSQLRVMWKELLSQRPCWPWT